MSADYSERRSLSHKIVRNTLYNTIGRFWGIIVGIFLTPYIVQHLGIERFGVWAIIGVITGYFGLLDFGIGSSFVKYIAEFYTKKEYENIAGIINSGFILYSVLGLIGAALMVALKDPILTLFNIPPQLHYEAAVVLVIGIALFGAANALSSFGAIQYGLQRMDIANNIGIAVSIVNIAGTIFVLERGYGLIGMMLNNVAIFIITAALNVVMAFSILPQLRLRIFHFDRAVFKRLFRFGCNIQVVRIGSMIVTQTDKVFISLFLSIGFVTFYQLGSSMVFGVTSLAAILTSALMPAFAEIEAMGDRPRLMEAYTRSLKYVSFFVMPAFIFLLISARQIMFIWMGPGYDMAAPIMQILAVAFLINTIAQVPASVSVSIDKPQMMAIGSIITMVANVILSGLCIKTFGFFGVAWGTLIAVNIGTIVFLATLHRDLKLSIKTMLKAVAPFFLICAFASGIIAGLWILIEHSGLLANWNRIGALFAFTIKGIFFISLYLAGIYYVKPFSQSDISLIKEKMPVAGAIIVRMFTRR